MIKFNWGMRACGFFLLWAATAVALPAQTFTTIYNFCSQTDCTDGAGPYAGLVQGTSGDFYGTTFYGGANTSCNAGVGCGTVFKITPGGKLTTLHSFDYTDGADPKAAPVQTANGNFFGTTGGGGANDEGTVFKITPSGVLTVRYNFCSQTNCTDGSEPLAVLVQGKSGNLYGTTWVGGTSGVCGGGCGTIFKITSSGKLTTLDSFNITDGGGPLAGLIQATNGKFYGTTSEGGAKSNGTIFEVTSNGTLTTLYSFCSRSQGSTKCTDGAIPVGGLVQGTSGNFYGTTVLGGGTGCSGGCGTVFKITPSGTLTTLHSFDKTDGANPSAGLIQGTDGNFYGTTEYGSTGGGGTIFKITPSGILTTLHSFSDEGYPYAGLIQGTNGSFYGTTETGYDGGTVFSLSVGLGPFVKTTPTVGNVGAAVTILGTNLTDVTNVRFNGLEAKFTIVSASEITTTVPNGATTGPVRVITPTGKLQSNVPFTVN
jgi:uncharacterized repeat protein (TIGR03803 family)